MSHRKQSFLCHTESTYFCHTESTESTEIYCMIAFYIILSVISVISVWPFFQHAGWLLFVTQKPQKAQKFITRIA